MITFGFKSLGDQPEFSGVPHYTSKEHTAAVTEFARFHLILLVGYTQLLCDTWRGSTT